MSCVSYSFFLLAPKILFASSCTLVNNKVEFLDASTLAGLFPSTEGKNEKMKSTKEDVASTIRSPIIVLLKRLVCLE